MRLDAVGEMIADPLDRIERVHRALRDQGNLRKPQPANPLFAERGHVEFGVTIAKQDAATYDPARWPNQAHDRQGRGGLAATGFTDQSESLTCMKPKGDTVDRLHFPAFGFVTDVEILDRQYIGRRDQPTRYGSTGDHELTFRRRGLAISSRPALIRKRLMNRITIATIGIASHHHMPLITALKEIAQ